MPRLEARGQLGRRVARFAAAAQRCWSWSLLWFFYCRGVPIPNANVSRPGPQHGRAAQQVPEAGAHGTANAETSCCAAYSVRYPTTPRCSSPADPQRAVLRGAHHQDAQLHLRSGEATLPAPPLILQLPSATPPLHLEKATIHSPGNTRCSPGANTCPLQSKAHIAPLHAGAPSPKQVDSSPDHMTLFHCHLTCPPLGPADGVKVAVEEDAEGGSKKGAEQKAAAQAVAKLHKVEALKFLWPETALPPPRHYDLPY